LLVTADGVRADESLLTGEAVPVGKRVASPDELAATPKPAETARVAPGGDELPTVYAGTLIVQGNALARVTATGERSEIGRIGAALGTVENERSPLQSRRPAGAQPGLAGAGAQPGLGAGAWADQR
jgi:Ca2+-transporting ATPase